MSPRCGAILRLAQDRTRLHGGSQHVQRGCSTPNGGGAARAGETAAHDCWHGWHGPGDLLLFGFDKGRRKVLARAWESSYSTVQFGRPPWQEPRKSSRKCSSTSSASRRLETQLALPGVASSPLERDSEHQDERHRTLSVSRAVLSGRRRSVEIALQRRPALAPLLLLLLLVPLLRRQPPSLDDDDDDDDSSSSLSLPRPHRSSRRRRPRDLPRPAPWLDSALDDPPSASESAPEEVPTSLPSS